MASLRDDALATALAGGLRSGAVARATIRAVGRGSAGMKCFADGSLGSRTAALLADIEPEPDRPLPPELRRGVWITEPERLRELVERAAAGGIATQIHAIGDAAVRAALDALEPTASRVPFMPRDRARPAARPGRSRPVRGGRHRRPASSRSISGRTRRRPGCCGAIGPRRSGYTWGSLAATGAVLAFGTDAPVEPFDPWPGIALAVRREDRALAGGTPPFGPARGAAPRSGAARRVRRPRRCRRARSIAAG